MKTSLETYIGVTAIAPAEKPGEAGTPYVRVLPENKYNKEVAKAKEPGATVAEPEVAGSKTQNPLIQAFRFYEVETDADFVELVSDPAQRANIVNRGLVLKQQVFVRDTLTDSEFEPVEGEYDLKEACAAATERKRLAPADKIRKMFSELTPEEMAKLLQEFQKASATA
jgi:hypothetical protein